MGVITSYSAWVSLPTAFRVRKKLSSMRWIPMLRPWPEP